MSHFARMVCLTLVVSLAALTACNERPAPFKIKDRTPVADREAPVDPPNTYPGWAFDQPDYVRPAKPLAPEPRVMPNDPPHYFTRNKLVMIRCPEGYTLEETPRVGIEWTDNNGFHWNKAGYFGRGQSYFPFEVESDGDYGVRFVGPGQEPAQHVLAYPERVYHVDTAKPDVDIRIEPEQTWYNVGDTVKIHWEAIDNHLVEFPVRIAMLMDYTADKPDPTELQRELPDNGTITYTIPPEALEHEISFRAEASDRAGNLGLAFSYALQVVEEPIGEQAEQPTIEPDGDLQDASTVTRADAEADTLMVAAANEAAVVEIMPAASSAFDEDGADDEFATAAPQRDVPFATAISRAMDEASQLIAESEAVVNTKRPVAVAAAPKIDVRQELSNLLDRGLAYVVEIGEAYNLPEAFLVAPSDAATDDVVAVALAVDETPVADVAETPSEIWRRTTVQAVDLTHGSRIAIPMPATVEEVETSETLATAHPWRVLGDAEPTPTRSVWALPAPRMNYGWRPVIAGRFLADNPTLRAVSEPAGLQPTFAGAVADEVPAESIP